MKKLFSMMMVVVLSLGLFAGCSQAKEEAIDTAQAETVKIENLDVKVAAPSGAPTLSMIKMFKENPDFGDNVTVSYESVKSADAMASKVISGEVDIAVVPTNLAAALYNKGNDYKIVASSVWGILYIVGNEEVTTLEDLKGKEIQTIGRGLTPDIVLRYVLSKNGINPDTDLTLTYMGEATEVASSFISGKASFAVIPEPALSNVMLKKPDTKVLFDLQEQWSKSSGTSSSYPQASLIISADLIENNPEFVDSFIKEYEAGIKWLAENKDLAGHYSEELETGLSKAAVVNGLERLNIEFKSTKDAKLALEEYIKVLFEYQPETVGGKLPDAGLYFEK